MYCHIGGSQSVNAFGKLVYIILYTAHIGYAVLHSTCISVVGIAVGVFIAGVFIV